MGHARDTDGAALAHHGLGDAQTANTALNIAELLEAAVEIPATPDGAGLSFTTLAKRSVLFGLLEYNARKDEYLMPRIIKEVLIRNARNVKPMTRARERLADYLLKFLKANICRANIKEPYWNALVCDEMVRVDPWWQIIDVVMHWPDGGRRAIEFALLMVHYMDSRFLNNQRLKFIELALKEPTALEARPAALLYIDALAWTYMEEGANQQARSAIDKGLAFFPRKEPDVADEWDDLRALAYAWRARIDAAEGKKVSAIRNIDLACRYVDRLQDKPWILLRIQMMAGDVKFMDDEPDNAIVHYMKAAEHAEFYGGEGDGYQINPRIGLALLEVRDKDGKLDDQSLQKARRRFIQLIDNSHVPTGRLYGQYGMALIAVRENLTSEARRQLQQVQKEIRHRSRGNVLLRLAEKSYEKILSSGSTLFD